MGQAMIKEEARSKYPGTDFGTGMCEIEFEVCDEGEWHCGCRFELGSSVVIAMADLEIPDEELVG